MITHTFVNKCNTIIKGSDLNTGLNPVAELNVGSLVTRIILNFDLSNIYKSIIDNEINTSNLKHILKMTNCGSINLPLFNENVTINNFNKKRANSFDIIAFEIPFDWDEGRGFDYYGDNLKETHYITSKDGSNWFKSKNLVEWDENGIYNNSTLLYEYEKYLNGESSIIIAKQHFDNGTENLELDLTNFINLKLNNKKSIHGIGIAFSPKYELETKDDRFISFFTNHTNTFFLPYLETINSDAVLDNRYNFHLGYDNKLYFFVTENGEYINLDEVPSCFIDNKEYSVKQNGKGVYYVEVKFKKDDVEPYTILYDTWTNLKLNGELLNDVEMEFVVLPMDNKVSFGHLSKNTNKIIPQLSGINDKERIKIGNTYEVFVDFIEEYSYGKKMIPLSSEYRIYIKENDREIDVYEYQPIETRGTSNSFIINSSEMVPNNYHIDIKIKQGRNISIHENVLEFTITNNITNYYK